MSLVLGFGGPIGDLYGKFPPTGPPPRRRKTGRPHLMSKGDKRRPETLLAHLGRNPSAHFGTVNTPVYHASTLIRESVEAYEEAGRNRWVKGKSSYGRSGTPTTFAFEETVAALEGAYGAVALSSGLQAIAVALMAFAKAGSHVLVPDS
ncbi:MAG TPA: PLP-dependent transferase, partial [Kiloniellaceae bacterium]|nr:PLP-dependent transferase [Kiloniellaceae bacterium]